MSGLSLESLDILLVEDQPENRFCLKVMLDHIGVRSVTEAANGADALKALQDMKPGLVMCDWNMPGMDGISLMKEIARKGYDLPFLMVTGRGNTAFSKLAVEGPINAYLSKPFTPEQLEAKIRALLYKKGMPDPSGSHG